MIKDANASNPRRGDHPVERRPRRTRARAARLAPVLALLAGTASLAFAADEIHWTFTGPTSVTFDWRGADSTIHYGLKDASEFTATGVTPSPLPFSSAGPFWEARITGLLPGATYHYSIEGNPNIGGLDHRFRTLPPAGSNYVVYAEGDVGDAVRYWRSRVVQSLIAEGSPAFVLVLGDLSYGNNIGQKAVDEHFNDVMMWSLDAAYMPVWGNHEWDEPTDDLRNYKGRFDLPNPQTSPNAPLAGCCGEDWYWFDCAGTRFIAYPEPYSGAWADWKIKATALMDAGQADSAIRFIVTFGHRPAYSSGHHPGSPSLRAILDTLGARHDKYVLNLNGHSHNYERSYPQHGVVHVTAGIGGATLEEAQGACPWLGGCPPPAWSAFRALHHGALRLRFGQASIRGEAYCGPSGDSGPNRNDQACARGEVFDAFTIGRDLPPVVSAPETVTVDPATPLRVEVSAADPDGDPIRSLTADFSPLSFAPGQAAFIPSSDHTRGTLTWTPTSGDVGSHAVTFRAQNELAGFSTTTIRVRSAAEAVGGRPIQVQVVRSNPAASALELGYSLASWAPARLELVDVAGRLVLRRDLGAPGPGSHEERLPVPPDLRPGLYWLWLHQGGRSAHTRVVVVR